MEELIEAAESKSTPISSKRQKVRRRVEGEEQGRRITERDIELVRVLARCRYLSTEQVARLVFRGRVQSVYSTRLALLERDIPPGAILQRTWFPTDHGNKVTVWALTGYGYQLALNNGMELRRVPDPSRGGAMFVRHAVFTNELYVGAIEAKKELSRFVSWSAGETVSLPFESRDGRNQQLKPDAVLEFPRLKRRTFIEYETGQNSLRAENKKASLVNKLDRYTRFLTGMTGGCKSFYQTVYPDNWAVRVLFVARTPEGRDRMLGAYADWKKKKFGGSDLDFRFATLDDAVEWVGIKAAEVPPPPKPKPQPVAAQPRPAPVPVVPQIVFGEQTGPLMQGWYEIREALRVMSADVSRRNEFEKKKIEWQVTRETSVAVEQVDQLTSPFRNGHSQLVKTDAELLLKNIINILDCIEKGFTAIKAYNNTFKFWQKAFPVPELQKADAFFEALKVVEKRVKQ